MPDEPITSGPPTPDVASAIRTEMATLTNTGSVRYTELQQKLEAHYKARYPADADDTGGWGGPASRAPEPRRAPPAPPAPAPASKHDEIRAQIDALHVKPYGVGESDLDRAEAIGALYRQLDALTSEPAGDPVIAAAEAKLRDLRPNTDEWARAVDEIDGLVLEQPVRPEDVAAMQQATEGLGLSATPEDVQDLARACNVIRYELGEAEVERVMMRGLAVIRRAEQDVQAGLANESWADVAPDLEAEWGSDGEHRVQDIREALLKLPPKLRAGLLRDKRVFYHTGVLRFLADVGAMIPVGPRARA